METRLLWKENETGSYSGYCRAFVDFDGFVKTHMAGVFEKCLILDSSLMQIIADALGIYYIFPQSRTTAEIIQAVCADDSPMRDICIFVFHLIDGQQASGFNEVSYHFIRYDEPTVVDIDGYRWPNIDLA